VLELFSDGRASVTQSAVPIAGSWALLSDGRVKVELNFLFVPIITTGRISNGKLLLTHEGETMEYRRQKR